ncbi:MAG: PRC-barrel domain-containing protein [Candidatus Sericytochromatia bacterium]
MTFTTTTGLMKLSETEDYGVDSDSHDIRGWSVVDESGAELGVVGDLLFAPETEQVRYVIVNAPGRHVVIPLGLLGFEKDPGRVVATGDALARLGSLEPYVTTMMASGKLTPEAERAFYLASVPGHKADDPLDYGIPVFQAQQATAQPRISPTFQL